MEQAFEILRWHARGANRRLHEVAAEVVRGDLTLDAGQGQTA